MATYAELYELRADSTLHNRTAVACVIAANTIRTEGDGTPNHPNRLVWAAAVLAGPESMAQKMLYVLLAQNKGATVEAIKGADDDALQVAVDGAIDLFATGS